ncbi:MAG: DNA mismatch repair protein MutL, partial [Anaerolineae bacterium]
FDALVSVWNLDTARQMIPVEGASEAGIAVTGFVSGPALHRGQRDQLVFFVNRRWIQDRALGHAVAQAYHTLLPVGRHPIAVLNIQMDPADVDVNVHPTKAEVKFKEPGRVFAAVQRPVRAAVIQDAPLSRPLQNLGDGRQAWAGGGGQPGDFAGPHPGPALSRFGLELQRTLPDGETPDPGSTPSEGAGMPPLRVVGQIQQTYIIAEGPDGLFLIDQHAAHERILYEKLMAQQQTAAVASQQLLTPPLLELTPAQAALVDAEMEALTAVGFTIEPFGGHSYRLLAVPQMLSRADPAAALADILAEMAAGAVPLARQTHQHIAIIVCKRASIKGGQTLSPEEMRQLIHQLEHTQNPRTCPHGRPTMIHLSAYQLAREFGRH